MNDFSRPLGYESSDKETHVGYWELRDIAGYYKTTIRTVQRWVRRGSLPQPFKMGRKRLWVPGQVMEWMETRCREAQTTTLAQNIENFMIPDRTRRRLG